MESLCAKNICVSSNSKTIINKVSLELKQGEFVCLCGPNGCGKSTLLSVLAGLPSANLKVSAFDDGFLPQIQTSNPVPIKKLSPKQRAKKISYMSQDESSMWDFSVFDIVLSGRFSYTNNGNYSADDKEQAYRAMEELEILNLKDKNVFEISFGEYQKARIARTLCQNADFMLFDEPTANLDFIYEPKILAILKERARKNHGIIAAIHNINLAARFADRMILLPPCQKEICGPAEQIINSENMKKTFCQDYDFVITKKENYVQVE